MSVLVLIEHNNQNIKVSSFNTITAAKKIDKSVHAIVLGENCSKIDFLRVFITFLRRSHDISIKMKKVGFMKTHLTNRKNV